MFDGFPTKLLERVRNTPRLLPKITISSTVKLFGIQNDENPDRHILCINAPASPKEKDALLRNYSKIPIGGLTSGPRNAIAQSMQVSKFLMTT